MFAPPWLIWATAVLPPSLISAAIFACAAAALPLSARNCSGLTRPEGFTAQCSTFTSATPEAAIFP